MTTMPTGPLQSAAPVAANEEASVPLPTRVALWVLLGVSLLILLILVEYQRKQAELVAARNANHQNALIDKKPEVAFTAIEIPLEPAQPIALAPREPLDATRWTTEMASAELAILRELAANEWAGEPRRTLKRLEPILKHGDETVRNDAQKLRAQLDEQLGAGVRQQARAMAEAAEDRADLGDFAGALAALEKAATELPEEPAAARDNAAKSLAELTDTIRKRREDARDSLLGAENAPNAFVKARELLDHTDELVRTEAKRRVEKFDLARVRAERAKEAQLENARTAWLKFIAEYRAAVLDGNLTAAEQLLATTATNGNLGALPTFDTAKVLKEMNLDVAGLKSLQNTALALPADKRPVDLTLRRGKVTGTFAGSRGRQLSVTLEGGAVVSVKIEMLTAGAFAQLLGERELDKRALRPAVWSLSAHENPVDAPAFMAKNYSNPRNPLPDFWKLQFSLEAFRFAESTVAQKMQDLQAALKMNDAEKARKALDEVQPALAALREFGPISSERNELVKQGEKLSGRLLNKTLNFQTGVFPNENYKGLNTDQISQYLDTQNKTDIGVQFGLKVGASGGLQRVLIKFDGLEAAIGKARVKKATLHLYQIESPRSLGATVGLFRLKRPWVPDAGTWRTFSSDKNCDWAVPGASGEDDITSGEDASVALDSKKGLWRTFDLTRYIQDVLQGRWQNNGLLMRVTNGEPDFHVRFYPETDVEAQKDIKLRPKLVLDLETEE